MKRQNKRKDDIEEESKQFAIRRYWLESTWRSKTQSKTNNERSTIEVGRKDWKSFIAWYGIIVDIRQINSEVVEERKSRGKNTK